MLFEITEAIWLDQRRHLTLDEVAELSGLAPEEVRQLLAYDALPQASRSQSSSARSDDVKSSNNSNDNVNDDADATALSGDALMLARTAFRLRRDFDLDPPALALVLSLLERMRALQARVRELEARTPGRNG